MTSTRSSGPEFHKLIFFCGWGSNLCIYLKPNLLFSSFYVKVAFFIQISSHLLKDQRVKKWYRLSLMLVSCNPTAKSYLISKWFRHELLLWMIRNCSLLICLLDSYTGSVARCSSNKGNVANSSGFRIKPVAHCRNGMPLCFSYWVDQKDLSDLGIPKLIMNSRTWG